MSKTQKEKPKWFGLGADRRPSDQEVTSAERVLGVTLPNEYKDFVRVYGGGYFAFANVLSLDAESDWNLLSFNEKYESLRADHVIFSDTGAGDFYGFRYVGGSCGSEVYLFDHDDAAWRATEYSNLFMWLRAKALKLQ